MTLKEKWNELTTEPKIYTIKGVMEKISIYMIPKIAIIVLFERKQYNCVFNYFSIETGKSFWATLDRHKIQGTMQKLRKNFPDKHFILIKEQLMRHWTEQQVQTWLNKEFNALSSWTEEAIAYWQEKFELKLKFD
jgi:hypothetical protein